MPDTLSVGLSATAGTGRFSVSVTTFAEAPRSGVVAAVPRDQLYYWSRQWQQDEVQALEDLAEGRSHEFANGTEAVRWLLSTED